MKFKKVGMKKFLLLFLSLVCATTLSARQQSTNNGSSNGNTTMAVGYNRPGLESSQTWSGFVQAEFLYWHCSEEGLSLGRRIPNSRTGTSPTLNEKILLPDFKYAPGFRLEAGVFSSAMDDWQLSAEWSRLHQKTSTSHSFNGTTEAVLLESWVHLFNSSFVGRKVKGAWKLDFDCLDLAVKRPFYSGKWLVLTPAMGLRTSWIDQSLYVTYEFTNTTPMHGNFESDSWGMGPLVGLDGRWKFASSCFGLIGKSKFSLLYTNYTKLKLYETIRIDTFAASEVNADYGSYHAVRASSELSIGVDWNQSFQQKRYDLYLAAMYTFNTFWNQNMLRGISDNYSFGGSETGTGSLNFHGLTLSARFNF